MRRPSVCCVLLALAAALPPFLALANAYASVNSGPSHDSGGYTPLFVQAVGTNVDESVLVRASMQAVVANVDGSVLVRALSCTDPAGNTKSVLYSPDLTPAGLAGTAAAVDWWEGCTRRQGHPQTTALPAHYSHGQRFLLTGTLTGDTCTSEERECKRARRGSLLRSSSQQGTQAVPGAAAAMVVDTPPAGIGTQAVPGAAAAMVVDTPPAGIGTQATAEAVPEVEMTQHARSSSKNNPAPCSAFFGPYWENPDLVPLNSNIGNGVYKELVYLTTDHLSSEKIKAARAALGVRLCAIVPADPASADTINQYNLGRATVDAAQGAPRFRTIATQPGAGLREDTLSLVIVMTCGTRLEPRTGWG